MTLHKEIEVLKADKKYLRQRYIDTWHELHELAAMMETIQHNVIYLLEKDEDALEKSI